MVQRQARKGNRGPPRKQGKSQQAETQRLRLTGGMCRGRRLLAPDAYLRPMMAQVRESLYNMLASTGVLDESSSMLDMFSGSGVVGLEALSRGMGNVTFVDSSSACAGAIRENCQELDFSERSTVIRARAQQVLAAPEGYGLVCPYQLVTLTPPYEEVDYPELLRLAASSTALAEDSLLMIEYPSDMGLLPSELGGGLLVGLRQRVYGRTVLGLFVNCPTGKIELKPKESEFAPPRLR